MNNRKFEIKKFNKPNRNKNYYNHNSSIINIKKERRIKLNQQIFKKEAVKAKAVSLIILAVFTLQFNLSGCGDSDITGINSTGTNTISASGISSSSNQPNSENILLSMNLSFGRNKIEESRFLESNNGSSFPNIVSIDRDLKPCEVLDLQELQPYGIFSLYFRGSGTFSLTNSDGMYLGSKTILLEKCSFIDLKLINTEQKVIHISGYIAGE